MCQLTVLRVFPSYGIGRGNQQSPQDFLSLEDKSNSIGKSEQLEFARHKRREERATQENPRDLQKISLNVQQNTDQYVFLKKLHKDGERTTHRILKGTVPVAISQTRKTCIHGILGIEHEGRSY